MLPKKGCSYSNLAVPQKYPYGACKENVSWASLLPTALAASWKSVHAGDCGRDLESVSVMRLRLLGAEYLPRKPPGPFWECLDLKCSMVCLFNSLRNLLRTISWGNTLDELGNPAQKNGYLAKVVRVALVPCFACVLGME